MLAIMRELMRIMLSLMVVGEVQCVRSHPAITPEADEATNPGADLRGHAKIITWYVARSDS
jgi:hypothetical protein